MRIFTVSVALAALLLLPGVLVGPSLDAAVFAEVASQVREGATLYVTAWDHKPPGIYLLLAIGQFGLPMLGPWAIAWLLSVVATASAATLIYASALRLGIHSAAALVASLFGTAAMTQYFTALGGGLTEPIAVLPLAGATYLLVHEASAEEGGLRSFGVGMLLSTTVLVSLQAAPGAAVLAALVVLRGPSHRNVPLRMLAVITGGLAPVMAVVAWLWSAGALSAATDALVAYPSAYRSVNAGLAGSLSTPVVAWLLLALLFLIVPAAYGMLDIRRSVGLRRRMGLASVVWIGTTLAFVWLQGRVIAHYLVVLTIPLSLLAGYGLDRILVPIRRAQGLPQRALLAAPLVGSVLISLAAGSVAGKMELDPIAADHRRTTDMASAIREQTADDDSIWVWGNEPQLYLEAGRPVAGSYSYLYPLVTPGYTTPEMVERARAELIAADPAAVVDAGSSAPGEAGFQSLLVPRPLASDGRDLDILDPLRDLIRERYVQASVIDGWILYLRQEP